MLLRERFELLIFLEQVVNMATVLRLCYGGGPAHVYVLFSAYVPFDSRQ